jgi:predicted N-acetyltransferase YhbS
MGDMLVRLYDLPAWQGHAERMAEAGVVIRRARAYELHQVAHWAGTVFSRPWQAEVTAGIARQPASVFVALDGEKLVGFACYDTTALGVAGPVGVDESMRGRGVGQALMVRVMHAMWEAGYAYAAIGSAGPTAFYEKTLGAIPIPGSTPGLYAHRIDQPPRDTHG